MILSGDSVGDGGAGEVKIGVVMTVASLALWEFCGDDGGGSGDGCPILDELKMRRWWNCGIFAANESRETWRRERCCLTRTRVLLADSDVPRNSWREQWS